MLKHTFLTLFFSLLLPLCASARDIIDFCGDWQFRKATDAAAAKSDTAQQAPQWEAVTLPHTWNATDMQLYVNRFYQGKGIYRKTFRAPSAWKGQNVFLRFEGVSSCAEVKVNGKVAATHRGAYSAFICDISTLLKYDAENEVVVTADNTARPDVIPVNHNLFGVYGGIYRPVSLLILPSCHFDVADCASPGVVIRQDRVTAEQADVTIAADIANTALRSQDITLRTLIADATGRVIAEDTQHLKASLMGTQTATAHLAIPNPHLWQGREDPYLYKVTVQMLTEGTIADEVVQPLGIRTIDIRPGEGVFLNGRRYPMYGVARHQDHWGKGSALTTEDHDEDLAMIMDVGATTVRLAHYQQSDYFYSRCDSLGLLVWAEIPFVNRVTGQEWDNAHSQLRELIRQSRNHPSIYIWGLHNEVYQPHDYTAALTASLHRLAKTEDPTRPTVSVNGYGHAEHPVNRRADVQGMNRYYGWYERKIKDIDAWVEGLEKNYPDMPLMLTEYGADGNVEHQTEDLGESLDWSKPFYPETFETKTHEYQWSVIAKHPYILASYVWNMFDFACPMWERGGVPARNMKGLVTFDRKVKKDVYYWYKANWSREPVLYLTQRRNTEREHRTTTVTAYSNCGTPTLYLNGHRLPAPGKGCTDVHFLWENVTLAKGKNTLRVVAKDENGVTHSDTIQWLYNGEQSRTAAQGHNDKEHSGF